MKTGVTRSLSGFTLLELLVVLVLVSLALTTVTPRLYLSLDNYRADAEERALLELVEKAGYHAFFQRRELTLHFRDYAVFRELPAPGAGGEELHHFDFLYFPERTVTWNHNGFAAGPALTYLLRDRPGEIILEQTR